jgi:hypothetical protein
MVVLFESAALHNLSQHWQYEEYVKEMRLAFLVVLTELVL